MDDTVFIDCLRVWLAKRNKNYTWLAEEIGVKHSTIIAWMSAKNPRKPNQRARKQIMSAFEVETEREFYDLINSTKEYEIESPASIKVDADQRETEPVKTVEEIPAGEVVAFDTSRMSLVFCLTELRDRPELCREAFFTFRYQFKPNPREWIEVLIDESHHYFPFCSVIPVKLNETPRDGDIVLVYCSGADPGALFLEWGSEDAAKAVITTIYGVAVFDR